MHSVRTGVQFALWFGFWAYWLIAARGTKSVVRHEPVLSRILHIAPLVLALWLLAAPRQPWAWLNREVVPWTPAQFRLGTLMLALGLGFAVMARRQLGGNWSGTVTLKRDHELIRSGPYRWTRHPIYTGLLLAFAGSAVARGEWRGVVAVALVAVAFARKLRVEERFMAAQFPGAYERYRAEVPALVPWPRLPRGRK
ncbi:MAG: isoprenylcysteine carboxylmethyltransferase family protein [Pseudomonadota bacterium]|nr:isoprenylcysteine carboxylmethyltransferase family protein [Pseudomonadota bacterium]